MIEIENINLQIVERANLDQKEIAPEQRNHFLRVILSHNGQYTAIDSEEFNSGGRIKAAEDLFRTLAPVLAERLELTDA